jgi:Glyoxalase-like domain
MATAALDHAVVNAMFETDAAASCFEALGFALTPRGYHSLGSVNHLMMFHDHYLELVGLPVGATTLRREVLESRLGIDGLVFKTDDAQSTYERLLGLGFKAGEPHSFTRPVEVNGREEIAQFRTTRLAAGELPAGRVYFCEHVTPQWVFRPEWAEHPNGARALGGIVVVGADPAADAQRYAQLAGGPVPGFELTFMSSADYWARYGELAAKAADRESFFGALVIEVAELGALRERLAVGAAAGAMRFADSIHPHTGSPSLVVLLEELNAVIEFIGAVDNGNTPESR